MIRIHSSLKEIMQVDNPAFYLYMFNLISAPNRIIMKQLVHNGYIGSNQLLFEIMELFHQLYETPIECSMFCHVLNSYLARYLQGVIYKYDELTPSICYFNSWVLMRPYGYLHKMPIKVENNSVLPVKNVCISNNSTRGLLSSNLHIFDKKVLDHPKEDFSLLKKVTVNAKNDCDDSFLSKKKNNANVNDLQSFLLPLEQDYTKSGKGYCQNKCNKNELENTVNLSSNNNLQNKEPVDDIDFTTSDDDEYYDPAQNLIISRYLNSLNRSSSESEVSYSEICWDSDSDDSIVFSENIDDSQETEVSDKCKASTSQKTDLNISFTCDSDSDASIEFVEMFDSKCEQSSKCYKYTYESNHDWETYNSNLFENFDISLHQKFDSSLKNDFTDSPFSLSQSKMTVFSTDFEGYSNPCFEDDNDVSQVNLKNINDKWENSMQAISCEPRQPKRVSFLPLPDLVSVQIFEPEDDNYRYSTALLDQIRFRNRIEEFEELIKPYLSQSHRTKVYQCYNSSND